MEVKKAGQMIPKPTIKGFSSIVVGIAMELLAIGMVLLALPPASEPSYLFKLNLLLAFLTLLKGALGMGLLRQPTLGRGRFWAALGQVPPFSQMGLRGEMGVVILSLFILVFVTRVSMSFLLRGGLGLLLIEEAQGILWLYSLRYVTIKRAHEKAHLEMIWFSTMWIGLALGWIIAGLLAFTFGLGVIFLETVAGVPIVSILIVGWDRRNRAYPF